MLTGEWWGRGWARSQIIPPLERLALYKSFNALRPRPCLSLSSISGFLCLSLSFPLPLLHSYSLHFSFPFCSFAYFTSFYPSHLPVALVTSNNHRTSLSPNSSLAFFSHFCSPSSSFSPSGFSLNLHGFSPDMPVSPPALPFPGSTSIPLTFSYPPPPPLFQYPFLSTYRYYPLCHAFFLSIIYPSCTIYFFSYRVARCVINQSTTPNNILRTPTT